MYNLFIRQNIWHPDLYMQWKLIPEPFANTFLENYMIL